MSSELFKFKRLWNILFNIGHDAQSLGELGVVLEALGSESHLVKLLLNMLRIIGLDALSLGELGGLVEALWLEPHHCCGTHCLVICAKILVCIYFMCTSML